MSADGLRFLDLTDAQREVLARLGIGDAKALLDADELELRAALGRTEGRRRALATKQNVEAWRDRAREHLAHRTRRRPKPVVQPPSPEPRWESAAAFTLVFEQRESDAGPVRQVSLQQTERDGDELTDPPTGEIAGWEAADAWAWIERRLPVQPELRAAAVRFDEGGGAEVLLVPKGDPDAEGAWTSGIEPLKLAQGAAIVAFYNERLRELPRSEALAATKWANVPGLRVASAQFAADGTAHVELVPEGEPGGDPASVPHMVALGMAVNAVLARLVLATLRQAPIEVQEPPPHGDHNELRVASVHVHGPAGKRLSLLEGDQPALQVAPVSGADPLVIELEIPGGGDPAQVALRVRLEGQRGWATAQVVEATGRTVRLSLQSLAQGRHEAKVVAWVPGLPSLLVLRLPVLDRL